MGTLGQLLARLQGQRVYIDANYLIYFLNKAQPYFDAVAPLFKACDDGQFQGFTGDAAVSEVMVYPYRTRSASEIARAKAFFAREAFLTRLGHDALAFELAAQFRAQSSMRLLDALHYATALQAGCRFMMTNDRDFKASGDLEVIPIGSLLG